MFRQICLKNPGKTGAKGLPGFKERGLAATGTAKKKGRMMKGPAKEAVEAMGPWPALWSLG
jgi:hypothetical protein